MLTLGLWGTVERMEVLLFLAALTGSLIFGAVLIIAILRKALWAFSGIFLLLDELMWFFYNPLRPFMKNREWGANRLFFYLLTVLLLKPIWQIGVWIFTTPLRIITALYFDVLVYLFVSLSDSIDELFNPKLGAMRFKKGFEYAWRWVVFFPKRFGWLILKNSVAVLDALLMFLVSVAWPTFTMYHGTAKDNVIDITRKGRWLVGPGNYGGSGIYFGRSPRVAIAYSKGIRHQEGRVIIARVTFTMLRNCATLREPERKNVARPGDGGRALAQAIRFPYFATEFWRTDHKWWEYCLLQGGKDGQHIKTWRIRPIAYVLIKDDNILSGQLERLWGGKGHYCLNPMNLLMGAISLVLIVVLLFALFLL